MLYCLSRDTKTIKTFNCHTNLSKGREFQSVFIKEQDITTLLLHHLQSICFLPLVYSLMDTRWLPQLKHHINSPSSPNAGSRRVNRCQERHYISQFFFLYKTLPQNYSLPSQCPPPPKQTSPSTSLQWRYRPQGHPRCKGIWEPKHLLLQPQALNKWISECFSVVWSEQRLCFCPCLSHSPLYSSLFHCMTI